MKNILKPLVITGALTIALVGCSNEKEVAPGAEKSPEVATSANVLADKLYDEKDTDVLVEVNGTKLTVGDVKRKAFEQSLIAEVNQFADRIVLIEKFGPTDKELEKEMERLIKSTTAKSANEEKTAAVASLPDKETIRYNMAYEKAVKDGVKVTDEDLKQIKKDYFPNEKRSFAEMKEELERVAPYYIGNNVYELTQELKKKTEIRYGDDELKKQLEAMFNPAPVTTGTEDEKKEEKN